MDSVWFVRPGPNPELMYSLRSAHHHADVENVWIVGDPPDWYTGPRIPGNRHDTKQRNVYDNVAILAEHPDLPETIAVWNDDFFALQQVTVQMAWRCDLAEHIAPLRQSWWRESLTVTLDYLHDAGIQAPLSYELHRPIPVDREHMAKILADAADVSPDNPPQWRTLYGNLAPHDGGVQDADTKVTRVSRSRVSRPIPDGPWVSTIDRSYPAVRQHLHQAFPTPSPWER